MNQHDPQCPGVGPYQNLSTHIIGYLNSFIIPSPANFKQGSYSEDRRMFCGFKSMWTTFFCLKNFKAEASI